MVPYSIFDHKRWNQFKHVVRITIQLIIGGRGPVAHYKKTKWLSWNKKSNKTSWNSTWSYSLEAFYHLGRGFQRGNGGEELSFKSDPPPWQGNPARQGCWLSVTPAHPGTYFTHPATPGNLCYTEFGFVKDRKLRLIRWRETFFWFIQGVVVVVSKNSCWIFAGTVTRCYPLAHMVCVTRVFRTRWYSLVQFYLTLTQF